MQQEYEANGCMGKPTAGVAGQFEQDELMLRPRERKPLTVKVDENTRERIPGQHRDLVARVSCNVRD
jgi:hypothetical protein